MPYNIPQWCVHVNCYFVYCMAVSMLKLTVSMFNVLSLFWIWRTHSLSSSYIIMVHGIMILKFCHICSITQLTSTVRSAKWGLIKFLICNALSHSQHTKSQWPQEDLSDSHKWFWEHTVFNLSGQNLNLFLSYIIFHIVHNWVFEYLSLYSATITIQCE